MKTVAITGPRQVELVDVPDPKAQNDLVVVKIHAAPMCCEYKDYKIGKNYSLGHEAAGEVVEVAQPGKVRVGDRVVVMPQYPCGKCPLCLEGNYIHCQNTFTVGPVGSGTYAQYVLKPDWLLVPISEGISYDHAAMACCGLGPTFGAMQAMRVDAFDTVLITGMGPVGLGGVINGVFRGARVIAVESHPYRADLAKAVGAFAVIDPNQSDPLRQVLDLTQGKGADKAIDCSGVPQAQRLLIDAARRKGHVAFVGEAGDLTIHIGNDLLRKGLTLHGIWHYNLADVPRILQVLRQSLPLLDKLITHRFPLAQVREAFELQLTGRCGKVILKPN
jgi:L-iditol 2-dehydrogenase